MLKYGVQGSQLVTVLFLIYNNDTVMVHINHTIKYCKKHHFGDDTNFLHFNSSIKKFI